MSWPVGNRRFMRGLYVSMAMKSSSKLRMLWYILINRFTRCPFHQDGIVRERKSDPRYPCHFSFVDQHGNLITVIVDTLDIVRLAVESPRLANLAVEPVVAFTRCAAVLTMVERLTASPAQVDIVVTLVAVTVVDDHNSGRLPGYSGSVYSTNSSS